jgi:hypothetical protein
MKIVSIILILLISVSCASSKKGGNCDAYSKIEKTKNPS